MWLVYQGLSFYLMENMMTNNVVYKVVRKLKGGTLVSSFVDIKTLWPFYDRLTYEDGKVTTQGEGSVAGIFCHRTLEAAKLNYDTSRVVPCTVEVHEVHPIGDKISSSNYMDGINYPAVLFGRKVADVKKQE